MLSDEPLKLMTAPLPTLVNTTVHEAAPLTTKFRLPVVVVEKASGVVFMTDVEYCACAL